MKIVADSCCDIIPAMRKELGVSSVPLIMLLEGKEYIDDDNLDLPHFIEDMKNCKGKIGSSSPPPASYAKAFDEMDTAFAVTLSSKLSGSYNNAVMGRQFSDNGDNIHVFDSKSASAGEILIVLKLREYIEQGLKKIDIIAKMERFINEMKTYFAIENVDNLKKNGRLNKVVATIITKMHISPIMGADGDGNIALFSHARGNKQIVEKMVDSVTQSGKCTEGERMVITHCNNESLATMLKQEIAKLFHFKDIFVIPTKGLSSMYVNEYGVIMAF